MFDCYCYTLLRHESTNESLNLNHHNKSSSVVKHDTQERWKRSIREIFTTHRRLWGLIGSERESGWDFFWICEEESGLRIILRDSRAISRIVDDETSSSLVFEVKWTRWTTSDSYGLPHSSSSSSFLCRTRFSISHFSHLSPRGFDDDIKAFTTVTIHFSLICLASSLVARSRRAWRMYEKTRDFVQCFAI